MNAGVSSMSNTPTSLFIEGRLWFDRNAGATYYSTRVWADGELLVQIGRSPGYGDHWLTATLQMLNNHGIVPSWRIQDVRRATHLYTTVTETRKKDLFENWVSDKFHQAATWECDCEACCRCAECQQTDCDCS